MAQAVIDKDTFKYGKRLAFERFEVFIQTSPHARERELAQMHAARNLA